jgi:anti-sigma factor RsiW
MSVQHLSDEAVAAFADGVLRGSARERAARHVAECAECRTAVRMQREAAIALRTAPAPALPSGLIDKLRTLPMTTPLPTPLPTAVDDEGNAMLATFAPMAAFAPAHRPKEARRRGRTYLTAALLAGVTGAAAATVLATSSDDEQPRRTVHPATLISTNSSTRSADFPVSVFHDGALP